MSAEIASLADLAAAAYLKSGLRVPESGITIEARDALERGRAGSYRRSAGPYLESRTPDRRFGLRFEWGGGSHLAATVAWRAVVGRELLSRACKSDRGIESGILSVYSDGGLCTHKVRRGGGVAKRHATACVATRCPFCWEIVARSTSPGASLHVHPRFGHSTKLIFPRIRLT